MPQPMIDYPHETTRAAMDMIMMETRQKWYTSLLDQPARIAYAQGTRFRDLPHGRDDA